MARKSGIVGLTDTIQPTLPNLGAIKKGELNAAGNPTKLNHFKFVPVGKAEGEISPLESLFVEAYGTQPKTIYGMFIGQTEEDVLWTGMRAAGKKGKTMRLCDRQICYSRTIQKGQDWVNERGAFECGFDAKTNTCKFKCKAEGRLSFVLMTPDGSEPLFVNSVGYPIGTVSHKLSETDLAGQTGFLAAFRGATLMAPLMGMIAKLNLREWHHSQFGAIYATTFMFAGIYAPFQRPAIAAPTSPITDIPTDLDDDDGLNDFGVDKSEVETTRPDVGTPPRKCNDEQYAWAWDNFLMLPHELERVLENATTKKAILAGCEAFANTLVHWDNPDWMNRFWNPFLDYIKVSYEAAALLVSERVPPDETRLVEYRKAVVQ